MKKYDTIIFDMDGTLLDTLDDLCDSVNYVLKQHEFPERTRDEIRRFLGNGSSKLIELSIPNGLKNPFYEKCLSEYSNHYSNNPKNKTAPYAGIIEMIKELSKRKFKMAIVSNKSDSDVQQLYKKFFDEYITAAIGESHGIMKKPAPDMVFMAIEELKSSSETAVYVGDSEVDLLTAHNANIPCISVSWGFRDEAFLEERGAELIADDSNELLEILCGHKGKVSFSGN